MKKQFLLAVILSFPLFSSATTITHDFTNLNGNTWQAEYTIHNDTLTSSIDEFTIWFKHGLYENISVVSTPSDWDPITIQPDIHIPDDGYFDALALSSGILSGESLDGFKISFDWLGTDTPVSQFFEIVDPATFSTIDSGQTSLSMTSIPEASTMSLLILGFAGLTISRRKNTYSSNR